MGFCERELLGVIQIDLSDDTQVNSGGGTNNQTLQPPEGLMYRISKIWFNIPDPVGSSAGSHSLNCYDDSSFQTESRLFYVSSNTGVDISTNALSLVGTSEVPGTPDPQGMTLGGVFRHWATYDNPIIFTYYNATDVNQTGTRTLKLKVEVYKNAL